MRGSTRQTNPREASNTGGIGSSFGGSEDRAVVNVVSSDQEMEINAKQKTLLFARLQSWLKCSELKIAGTIVLR